MSNGHFLFPPLFIWGGGGKAIKLYRKLKVAALNSKLLFKQILCKYSHSY